MAAYRATDCVQHGGFGAACWTRGSQQVHPHHRAAAAWIEHQNGVDGSLCPKHPERGQLVERGLKAEDIAMALQRARLTEKGNTPRDVMVTGNRAGADPVAKCPVR